VARWDLALAFALVCGEDAGQWHVPNGVGQSEENLFKNAKGWAFSLINCLQSPSRLEADYFSPWRIFISKVSRVNW